MHIILRHSCAFCLGYIISYIYVVYWPQNTPGSYKYPHVVNVLLWGMCLCVEQPSTYGIVWEMSKGVHLSGDVLTFEDTLGSRKCLGVQGIAMAGRCPDSMDDVLSLERCLRKEVGGL